MLKNVKEYQNQIEIILFNARRYYQRFLKLGYLYSLKGFYTKSASYFLSDSKFSFDKYFYLDSLMLNFSGDYLSSVSKQELWESCLCPKVKSLN